jgi:hypothetical protein
LGAKYGALAEEIILRKFLSPETGYRTSAKGASPPPPSYADFAVPPGTHPWHADCMTLVAYCCCSCLSLRPPHGVCQIEQFQQNMFGIPAQ